MINEIEIRELIIKLCEENLARVKRLKIMSYSHSRSALMAVFENTNEIIKRLEILVM